MCGGGRKRISRVRIDTGEERNRRVRHYGKEGVRCNYAAHRVPDQNCIQNNTLKPDLAQIEGRSQRDQDYTKLNVKHEVLRAIDGDRCIQFEKRIDPLKPEEIALRQELHAQKKASTHTDRRKKTSNNQSIKASTSPSEALEGMRLTDYHASETVGETRLANY